MKRGRARARIPRQIDGAFTLDVTIDDQRLTTSFERALPSEDGAFSGSGAEVVVTFDCDDGMDDDRVAARGADFLIRAANIVLQAVAFEGGNKKRVEQLTPGQFESRAVDVEEGADWRALELPVPERAGPIRLKTTADLAVVQAGLDAWIGEFGDCGRLWRDVLVSFYEARYAEVLMFARACVELAWNLALRRAFAAIDAGTFVGNQSIARALRKQASDDRMGLGDRLLTHAPAYFGFSFAEEFDAAEWGRFISFLNRRNDVAHGAATVTIDEAWLAMGSARLETDKILELAASFPAMLTSRSDV